MDAFSAAKAKMGAKSGGEAAAAAGLAAPQPAATAPSPAGPGSPSAPEPTAYKLEDLETLATVGTGTFGRVHLVKEKNGKALLRTESNEHSRCHSTEARAACAQ